MMSNKGLNSNEALDESTATNSSVTLSGIRREKEALVALDIEDYTPDPRDSDPPSRSASAYVRLRRDETACRERLTIDRFFHLSLKNLRSRGGHCLPAFS